MQGTVCSDFFLSIIGLKTNGNAKICVVENSLVYDARNKLALRALQEGYDYILWIDSDMTFEPDALLRLLADAYEGREYVSGLCFTRTLPSRPAVCKELVWECSVDNPVKHEQEVYKDYPKDAVFEVAATGAAFLLVKTSLIREIAETFHISPFHPLPFLGEDYSFCIRARQLGKKMYCDSRVKIGHVGKMVYDEDVYLSQRTEA